MISSPSESAVRSMTTRSLETFSSSFSSFLLTLARATEDGEMRWDGPAATSVSVRCMIDPGGRRSYHEKGVSKRTGVDWGGRTAGNTADV
jgi:hypothetical protein